MGGEIVIISSAAGGLMLNWFSNIEQERETTRKAEYDENAG